MLILDAEQTRSRTPYAALIPALADAVVRLAAGGIHAPERQVLPLPGNGRYLAMPAADARLAICKLVTVHPDNPALGLPAIHGLVVVSDAVDGRVRATLDGPTLTARRTAALSMLGLQRFHATAIDCVALVGIGAQAREHARALHEVFGARLQVFGREPIRTHRFCAELRALGIDASAHVDVDAALAGAQAVITLTTSRTPVLPQRLPETLTIVAVGAYTPEMVEIPASLVRSRRCVVDTLAGARHEAGDLIQAGADWSSLLALADCLGPDRPRHNVLFKTVGHAAWDLAAAGVALAAGR